jgi:hypothetical protein
LPSFTKLPSAGVQHGRTHLFLNWQLYKTNVTPAFTNTSSADANEHKAWTDCSAAAPVFLNLQHKQPADPNPVSEHKGFKKQTSRHFPQKRFS